MNARHFVITIGALSILSGLYLAFLTDIDFVTYSTAIFSGTCLIGVAWLNLGKQTVPADQKG
ncbi:MAG: hypothetical protein AAGI23_08375 [Bacteroidota bacterium]